jgi:beta-lactamase class A
MNNSVVYTILSFLLTGIACGPAQKLSAPPAQPVADAVIQQPAQQVPAAIKSDAFLEDLLKANPQYFDSALRFRKEWKVQIVYTQIDRQSDNSPVFKTYYFNIDPNEYFYPASTVKMPIALLALQKLHELRIPGMDMNSSMVTEAAYSRQTPVYNDATTPDGRPTIAQYVKKIFLVSDNDAFNRLYEFLGQEYINDKLHEMGYADAEILHRLDVVRTQDENRHTNPIKFFNTNSDQLYSEPMQFNEKTYSNRTDSMGKGYYSNGQRIERPMDCSKKNRISLEDLTNILKSVFFPAAVPPEQRFFLSQDDYKLVRQYMSQFPGETIYPSYDSSYQDAYVKLLLYGTEKGSLPKHIRIFNKEGDAYGCLTDVAYIVDFDKQVEFMLSARIYCNTDGYLNDSKYDYETIGYPFMKHLGQVLYNYELQRKRTYKPDLTEFKMTYDK